MADDNDLAATGERLIELSLRSGRRDGLHLPLGGWAGRQSGRARLGGRQTLEHFTQLETTSLDVP